MEKDTQGLARIIRVLDEELTELLSVGLYKQAEETRKRLLTYVDMRNQKNAELEERVR
jgi:hypothetical protein